MRKASWLLGLGLMAAGCDSLRGPHQSVVAPAVRGRVLEAGTGEPIRGARVSRTMGGPPRQPAAPKHAAEQSRAPAPAWTDAEGRFALGEVRAGHLLFEPVPALVLSLRVEHRRYRTGLTNYDLLKVERVREGRGEVIEAGDIWIEPKGGSRRAEPVEGRSGEGQAD